MAYKIFLDNGFSGEHMGLVFAQGEAHTKDAFLASRLQSKGYSVTDEAVADDETVSEQGEAAEDCGEFTPFDFERMTVAQLKEYAKAGNIALDGAKTKDDIIAAIMSDPESE